MTGECEHMIPATECRIVGCSSRWRDFADLGAPPEGIEDIQVGQRIELLEDGELVGLVEVIAEWTRGRKP